MPQTNEDQTVTLYAERLEITECSSQYVQQGKWAGQTRGRRWLAATSSDKQTDGDGGPPQSPNETMSQTS